MTNKGFNRLEQRFPGVLPTLERLSAANITWAITGSACLYLHGNDREPGDIDILIPDDQHDRVDSLFNIASYQYTSPVERVRNSNPGGNHDLQFTSHLVLHIAGQEYQLRLSPEVIAARQKIIVHGATIWTVPPEEVMIAKALLQRGPAEQKHDIEDIRRWLQYNQHPNIEYVKSRIATLHAEERAGRLLHEEFHRITDTKAHVY